MHAPPPAPAPAARPIDPVRRSLARVAVIHLAHTPHEAALVDRRGFAPYRFTHDRPASITCYGACAVAWPPYVVANRALASGTGAHTGLLGTVRRRDGRLQVTYAGHPLYYFIDDRRPGEVLCQAVPEFGGTGYVLAANGHAIH
jgi:predicted lipoprotein with Yx(FWY)xxD motif